MIYLNNSATSYPKPESVIRAVNNCIEAIPIAFNRAGIEHNHEDIINNCRSKIAKLFNISNPKRIAFQASSTAAINVAIKGLRLAGAEVITSVIEHNSVLRPLKTLERDNVITLKIAERDANGEISAQSFEQLITKNTKLIVVNHCSNVSGEIVDLEGIIKSAHQHNILVLVDASQSAGIIPIDCDKLEIDLLAFTAHKGLYGIQGLGGLYVREGIELTPLISGGTGTKSDYLYQPNEMPTLLEAGTPNTPAIAALSAGIDFINDISIDKIFKHKRMLYEMMHEGCKDILGITIYSNSRANSYSNFTFSIDGFSPEEVNYYLESTCDIIVRSGYHCAPLIIPSLNIPKSGSVRISPSYFTTIQEIEIFINALNEIYLLKQ